MRDLEPASEQDIERVSPAWLASRAADEALADWVENWQDTRCFRGDYMSMWRFVLKLCEDVVPDDSETIGMIGVDPLWSMIYRWADETLTLLEAETGKNPTLLEALSVVITDDPAVRDRIDAILAHQ